jgi:hypothetical protein
MVSLLNWTYGCELQLPDWDTRKGVPPGFGIDRKETGNMNSNGVSSDPKGITYPFGGEVLTPPTTTIFDQGAALEEFLKMHPVTELNHRSSLHVHIGVPGLLEDLDALKRINQYNLKWLPLILPRLEPMPRPTSKEYPIPEELEGALRRWRKRSTSHHRVLKPDRVAKMSEATTVEEFFNAEIADRYGKLHGNWPRTAVNLRRLWVKPPDIPTVEFRHFPGTLDPNVLIEAVAWCRDYLEMALVNVDPNGYLQMVLAEGSLPMPTPPYVHWREVIFRHTTYDGTLTRAEIAENIAALENAPQPVC